MSGFVGGAVREWTRVRNYGYVVFFLPMDGGTYTVERQTKTYVPNYESMFLLASLWTRPSAVISLSIDIDIDIGTVGMFQFRFVLGSA